MNNLFRDFPTAAVRAEEETFEDLLARPDVRIERIVSTGQASPPGFWYSQPQGEWVVVLQGAAGLLIEGEPVRELRPGDFINIPAYCRHRVEWTEANGPTVWLAVHYELAQDAPTA
ncbi:cupin domain-containing protein [Nissabacter sp. SGAir0207]|uniref:cupin domain-containing protein n=1 Tax=Nissabacter sp. SGAir0207 TaxID=2126321 RepID=UPI0010CD6257|nr:cupin domain-containing protein [Nissabacter sp. SGAir0207]QCR35793.1 cupin [Nissabacter sp. SGAir0207]